ncbi:helix-turn-helix domain-containing protein [Nostoc sp. FACHB-152]|uniref:helix-turn-helix domain-containing protein n=1 Tax=unclassified Nostoc TaxID=2593658 RepID=UPI001688BE94|nr:MULTISPECIES: RodZ domain-containing protein [unclassified Nostoc]MBD2446262.1 helix-turn-helix domain-containing protein [Nostoc sp. FACHB-152]MBD2469532.1 helix-turn-helix domain-containing protein [Nostoc sp. FACHB-145]
MNLLQDNQTAQLKEISKHLLQVREAKSIRLEEVAMKTNIRLTLLKALDDERFDELPEPVYIQGYIRRYADVIGLDGASLAKTFATQVVTPEFDSHQSPNFENKLNIRIPLFIPYAALLLVSAIGLVYLLNPKLSAESLVKKLNFGTPQKQTAAVLSKPSLLPTAESSPSSTQAQTSVTSQNSTTGLPLAASPIASPNTPTNQAVAVSLELQGTSWLQVKVDSKTEFVGNLNQGERRTWTAKKQLTVRSGNAGAVLISVNNQPAKPLGELGNVKEVTFTPEIDTQKSIVNSQ